MVYRQRRRHFINLALTPMVTADEVTKMWWDSSDDVIVWSIEPPYDYEASCVYLLLGLVICPGHLPP